MDPRSRLTAFQHALELAARPEQAQEGPQDSELDRTKSNASAQLRQLSQAGIPDHPADLRPRTYHVLLGLPPTPNLLEQYSTFVEEIMNRVRTAPAPTVADQRSSREDKLLREIERDVSRTFGGLAWFGAEQGKQGNEQDVDSDALWDRLAMLDKVDVEKAAKLAAAGSALSETTETKADDGRATKNSLTCASATAKRPRTRRQQLLRPLFVYAMLNPGLGYVQGMNSLIAVFLWIFLAPSGSSELESEASAFFALGAILSQLRDLYVPSLDSSTSPRPANSASSISSPASTDPAGLGATLSRFESLLSWLDADVAAHLQAKGIDPALYCFRWLTTLFANEFHLPDLVRIWDRVMTLYPAEHELQPVEALSPVLGHLIDISLAMVLTEKRLICSPYSSFPKIVARLQDPQIEGEQIDRLLAFAWDIRDRRLGRGTKRASVVSDASGTWKNAASKWAAAASAAASQASTSSTATSLRSRFWSNGSTDSQASLARAKAVSDFELAAEDVVSVASSDTGSPNLAKTAATGPSFAEQVATVDGRALPPPPDRIDEQQTLAALIEAEMRYHDDDDSYAFVDDDDAEGPTLKERAATSWSGWKSRFASSDTAAALSKAATNLQIKASVQAATVRESAARSDTAATLSKTTTNLSIQAQLLRDQLAHQGPERLATIKESVAGASGRLLASTGSGHGPRRPGSPVEEPFTPPRWSMRAGPGTIRRPPSPPPFVTPEVLRGGEAMQKSWSNGSSGNGPKPLLLSSSARRASNASEASSSAGASASKRNSFIRRSPSTSPHMGRQNLPTSPDLAVPIGSASRPNSRGSHGRSASSAVSVGGGHATASAFTGRTSPTEARGLFASSEDVPIQSLRLNGHEAESPTATRIRRPIPRYSAGGGGSLDATAVAASGGWGWALRDMPVPSLSDVGPETAFDPSALGGDDGRGGGESDRFVSPAMSPGQSSSSNSSVMTAPEEVPDSVRAMFAAASADHDDVPPARGDDLPPRRSSLNGGGDAARTTMMDSSSASPSVARPPRGSSLNSSLSGPGVQAIITNEPLSMQDSLTSVGVGVEELSEPAVSEDVPRTLPDGSSSKPVLVQRGSKVVRRPGAARKRLSSSRSSLASASVDFGSSNYGDDVGQGEGGIGGSDVMEVVDEHGISRVDSTGSANNGRVGGRRRYGTAGPMVSGALGKRSSVASVASSSTYSGAGATRAAGAAPGARDSMAWETGDFLDAYGDDAERESRNETG